MKNLLGVRKPGQLKRVGRVMTGPEVAGSRPVIVTFPTFPAREEIWKRAGRLAGSSLYISEDVTRRAKDSRTELRRFMREVKSVDPAAEYRCLGNLSEKSPSFDSFGKILPSLFFQDGV